ncbi:hypothetical protein Ddye_015184 [Dipteronia dyeriana]|uniref:Uncharacterized protein n=1 Tax=Dipteronia dyeriana TaxID=168575 RepID=A0AAD9U585_9ROSI|nr:hypothetical protein Ddye_015184 [Dipteronia dyeriana]
MLGKQCWRIVNNPDSLASKILKRCYFPNETLITGSKKKNYGSFAWKSLLWGKGILEAGMRWRVGNGTAISIYKDNWIPNSSFLKILSHPKLGVDATVNRLISSSGGWNMEVLNQNFSMEEINGILQIPVGGGEVVNTNIWHFEKNGCYSVKSGYWVGKSLTQYPSSSSCSNLVWWWKRL